MTLNFDHAYTTDKRFRFRKKLGKAGFKLDDRMVEHPGKMFCKFISFPNHGDSRAYYLEFVHEGKGAIDFGRPGLSLRALEALKPFSTMLKSKGLKVRYAHKNYDWKKNSKDLLPGWNFVDFPKHKSSIYTWLTEYEYSKKRKRAKEKHSKHPNQVYKIVSFEVEFSRADVSLFTKLCGAPKNSKFGLNNGVILNFKLGKKSRITAVVVATKDLGRLVKTFEWDELVVHEDKPAVRIINPDARMWDVIVVESVNA